MAEEAGVAAGEGATPLVYTVNYPLAYMAERIGGDLVRVQFPAPRDVDPAFWSPGPETVTAYQTADLILLNGAGYASWTDRVSLPGSRLVATSASVADRYVVEEDAVTHSHGPAGEHAHGAIAFTTWLDPTIAVEQARAVRDARVRSVTPSPANGRSRRRRSRRGSRSWSEISSTWTAESRRP